MKTLVFRTDRIGDFLISCPFIISYKKAFKNNSVEIISSEYNFKYIKNFKFIDNVLPLSIDSKFLRKIFLLLKMIFFLRKTKYNDIIVLDGKKDLSLYLYF